MFENDKIMKIGYLKIRMEDSKIIIQNQKVIIF
jgi:hypothetical protein